MLRHLYFRTRFNQWFKNHEGLKAFAQQCINWIMRGTLRLAARLKKRNAQLAEKVETSTRQLNTRLESPTVEADDFPTIKKENNNYSIVVAFIIITEAFFNYFAANAIFTFTGWPAIAAKILFAIVLIVISVPLFRNIFTQFFNERHYKKDEPEPRNWLKLLSLTFAAIVYELGIYSLCKLRGEQIEGQSGGFITTVMIIVGILLPIFAGYFDYERRRYYNPYINTLRINKLRHRISLMNNEIRTNLQRMENHFKQRCEELWAYFQEFKAYKENYNRKRSIPEENLSGHFCEAQPLFVSEAIDRYNKRAIALPEYTTMTLLHPRKDNEHNSDELLEAYN